MDTGWRYRIASVTGVAVWTALAVVVVNSGTVQQVLSMAPVLARLPPDPPAGAEYAIEVGLTVAVVVGALVPLYKPRPRRILDVVALTHKRVLVAVFALATIGYFDYTYKVPRLTLVAVTPILFVVVPAWLVWLRRPETNGERAIIVGDDLRQIEAIATETDLSLLGYLCPTPVVTLGADRDVDELAVNGDGTDTPVVSDGGYGTIAIDRLGGLSRLEDILVEQDVDTAVLAFTEADRAEFFGALDACYEHGVAAKVHQAHADTVLTAAATPGESLVDVEIEPWDIQDYVFKRAFDVVFALGGLLVLLPVIGVIAGAIKLDSPGPVLYEQDRTATFGETFSVYKFRSMIPDAESETGVKLSDEDAGEVDPRVTRVGRVLRATHLDEIPQLWSILRGDMSVVGPRPERPEIDTEIKTDGVDWSKRWFIKPGLTGLAQINDATGYEPRTKLRYDIQYVREQSFVYDTKIVVRQIWMVLVDAASVVVGQSPEESDR